MKKGRLVVASALAGFLTLGAAAPSQAQGLDQIFGNIVSGVIKDPNVQRHIARELGGRPGTVGNAIVGSMMRSQADAIPTCQNYSGHNRQFQVDNRTGQVYYDRTTGYGNDSCYSRNYGNPRGQYVGGGFSANPTGYGR